MEEKKPRWEVAYERYLSEEPVKDRIADVERGILNMNKYIDSTVGLRASRLQAEIESLKNQKVTGNFKTKEEYEKAVAKHQGLIASKEMELKNLEEQIKTDKSEYASKQSKKLEGYKNFEKNKDKIKNILEYRNKLQEALDKLPKDNKEKIEQKKAEISRNEKILQENEKSLDELIKYVNSNPKSTDLVKKQQELSITAIIVRDFKEQRGKLDGELQQLEDEQKLYEENVEPNKAIYERKIAKCNIIAANLLKGKDLGDFEIKVKPEGKKFTSPDGKLPKETSKAREGNKVKENSEAEKLNEEKYGEPEPVEQTEIEQGQGEDLEENAIAEVSTFAEKHPRLAKIAQFFKNVGTGVANKIKGVFKKEDVSKTDNDSAKAEKEEDKDDREYEEFIELINPKKEDKGIDVEIDNEENKFLKEIAEKGEKTVIEDRRKALMERLAQNKLDAANRYAQQYGGNYEKQDGATAKKVETSNTPEKAEEDELELS